MFADILERQEYHREILKTYTKDITALYLKVGEYYSPKIEKFLIQEADRPIVNVLSTLTHITEESEGVIKLQFETTLSDDKGADYFGYVIVVLQEDSVSFKLKHYRRVQDD